MTIIHDLILWLTGNYNASTMYKWGYLDNTRQWGYLDMEACCVKAVHQCMTITVYDKTHFVDFFKFFEFITSILIVKLFLIGQRSIFERFSLFSPSLM